MANQDKLVFPIGFDLESGVKQVEHDWEKTYRKRLQSVIDSKPIKIKLDFDANGVNLKDYKEYIALSKQAAQSAKENALAREAEAKAREREAKATQQASNARVAENTEAERTRRIKAQAALTEEKLAQAKERSARATNTQNSAYATQSNYLQRLIQRMVAYASVTQVLQFLRNVREVTAEFELQRTALGAIIGDANRANLLFGQIKEAAVKSPFQVKELVTYTKQLAAYKIETEELFETTQRLGDISAGIGVSMDRLILAYGQIRATGYLRASEVRQLTEAGIPIVEELAKKMSEFRNETVSAADVMEMISERAVSFEQVKEVFDDMTSAGGMFYKMQEKQSETLRGQLNNLKDSFAIMYDEIGRSEGVNSIIEAMISLVKGLAENWKIVGGVLASVVGSYVGLRLGAGIMTLLTTSSRQYQLATLQLKRAITQLRMAQKSGTTASVMAAKVQVSAAMAQRRAAMATSLHAKAWERLKAAFMSNPIGFIITALVTLISLVTSAVSKANELSNALGTIDAKGGISMDKEVHNFERLAAALRNNTTSSKKHKEALKELKRTYGDFLPVQDDAIRKLVAEKEGYENVTDAIREKIAMQMQEEKMSTITNQYAELFSTAEEEIRKKMKGQFDTVAIGAFIAAFKKQVKEGHITPNMKSLDIDADALAALNEALGTNYKYASDLRDLFSNALGVHAFLSDYVRDIQDYYEAIDVIVSEMSDLTGLTRQYKDEWNQLQTDLENVSGGRHTPFSFNWNETKTKNQIDLYHKAVQKWLKGVDIDFTIGTTIDFNKLYETIGAEHPKLLAILRRLQKQYSDLILNKESQAIKDDFIKFAKSFKAPMDMLQHYFKDNEQSIKTWLSSIKSAREDIHESIGVKSNLLNRASGEEAKKLKKEIEDMKASLKVLDEIIKTWDFTSKTEKKEESEAIQTLRNEISAVETMYKKYLELRKKTANEAQITQELDSAFPELNLKDLSKVYNPEDMAQAYKKAIEIAKKLGANDLVLELQTKLGSFNIGDAVNVLENKLSKLSVDISRTKTAKEFFDKMLGMTGDKQLSATLTMSVYGIGAEDLGQRLAGHLIDTAESIFGDLDISSAIDKNLNKIDYTKLRELLDTELDKAPENRNLSDAQIKQAKEFVENGEKANAEWIQNLYKTYKKAIAYDKQRTQVQQEEAQKRKEIEESNLDKNEKQKFIDASNKREAERLAAINLEEFKETPEYLRIFEEVEYLSIPIIDRLIKKLREFIATNKALNATDLKNLTEQINKLEEGKARKSAWFAGLGEGIKEWGKAMTAMRKATKGTKEYDDAVVDANKAHSKVVNSLDNLQNEFSQAQSLVENFANAIGVAEDSGFGIFLDGLSNTLGGVVQALSFASLAVKIFDGTIKSFLASNPIGWVLLIVSALIGAAQAIMNARVKKLDREIEGVQRTLDDLEYSFERFEKAQEKAFGTEYIDNYQQKLANLQAQYDAYKKQLETEQKKGKKADDSKVTEYENAMRDTTDAIKDMETELSEYFLGTDLSSAARDFAQAWIDAYKEFGNTADAMSDKFQEMIENMIVESFAAKVMQSVLQPIFDEIDKMSKDGVLDMNEASQVAGMAQSAVSTMDIGMNNLMAALQAAGISVRGMGGDLTGISRDIATASEESILGLAAGINTQNYYISQVPAKMDIIIALLRGEGTMPQSSAITLQDMVTLQNQHLSYLPTIAQHTADTVAECKAIVAETRRTADALERVIKPEGTKAAYKLNTTLS